MFKEEFIGFGMIQTFVTTSRHNRLCHLVLQKTMILTVCMHCGLLCIWCRIDWLSCREQDFEIKEIVVFTLVKDTRVYCSPQNINRQGTLTTKTRKPF